MKKIIFIVIFFICSCSKSEGIDPDLEEYLLRFEEEPENCFLANQIGLIYQAREQYEIAILYLNKAINNCPDDPSVKFQLGATHYIQNDKDLGKKLMDEAIEQAQQQGDTELYDVFVKEKAFWVKYYYPFQEKYKERRD